MYQVERFRDEGLGLAKIDQFKTLAKSVGKLCLLAFPTLKTVLEGSFEKHVFILPLFGYEILSAVSDSEEMSVFLTDFRDYLTQSLISLPMIYKFQGKEMTCTENIKCDQYYLFKLSKF